MRLSPLCGPIVSLALVLLLILLSTLEAGPLVAADNPKPGQAKPRARDLGIPFEGTPGPLNAITDVKGVEVGYTTLIAGEGKLQVGTGPVRTGVTAILPRGKQSHDPVFAGWFALNGNGEMTGTTWVEESGFLEGPVLITNTHSVGVVRDAVVAWQVKHQQLFQPWALPVVAETWDGFLNDSNGFHVKERHVWEALDNAQTGPIAEGNVGGGTGMICYGFKGGTGTASRTLPEKLGGYTVGVLVQANHGSRQQLQIAGVPVGHEIADQMPATVGMLSTPQDERGSIIILIATDAPLLSHQLKRIARRAALGVARTGAAAGNSSGDIFLAFSTANAGAAKPANGTAAVQMLTNDRMTALFSLTMWATEEAIINALVAAETMTGADNHQAVALPHDRLREVMKKYQRLAAPGKQ
ncbi:MAG TPA: P1 family peptidase [Gemmataceae bacterium]|nr:P1 family peptidase [Gemmataceae bacterium]